MLCVCVTQKEEREKESEDIYLEIVQQRYVQEQLEGNVFEHMFYALSQTVDLIMSI